MPCQSVTMVTSIRDKLATPTTFHWHDWATTLLRAEGLCCVRLQFSRAALMDKHEAISRLRSAFPEFDGDSPAQQQGMTTRPRDTEHEFARFVTHLFANPDSKRVRSAFDQVEDFLCNGSVELRKWVFSFLEALQDMAGWKASGSDVFLGFLGPETKRAWNALETIRRDLEDYSALEAEVLMWRVVHRDLPPRTRVA
jgi:hypothetical protein